ncbi:MAG: NADH-quinone oxidoreductase subunit NuoE [Phycisphaera sp.]|nr:NADH-quinone oxidoreductase subunit NuoE [Phycisphaera sp.]
MAWITKNSGSATVARRDEPYLTDEMKAKAEREILPRFPTKQAATIPLLHEIQHAYNWIPMQAIEELAAYLELSASQVLDTATFYEEFFLEPRGEYTVWVCRSISCELMGQDKILRAAQDKLGIEPGQTTPDGKFTLMHVECLGSCGTAPCALVGEKLHECLTPESFAKILDETK